MIGSEDEQNLVNKFSITMNDDANMFNITKTPVTMINDTNANGFWKYNEDKILKQLEEYISGTYSQHYVDRTGCGT